MRGVQDKRIRIKNKKQNKKNNGVKEEMRNEETKDDSRSLTISWLIKETKN